MDTQNEGLVIRVMAFQVNLEHQKGRRKGEGMDIGKSPTFLYPFSLALLAPFLEYEDTSATVIFQGILSDIFPLGSHQ